MSRLVLVERPADAPPAAPGTRVVVLDPAWTPAPGARGDIEPIRPIVRDVAAEVDVIHDSLAALDAWAAAARLPDAFVADGVTWWYRARMLLRWDVHELVLWRLVLRRLLAQPVDRIDLPGARPLLATAVRMGVHGGRPTMHLTGTPTLAERARQLARSGRLEVGRLRRRLTGPNRATGRRLATAMERTATMERRLLAIGRDRGGVVGLVWPRAFQVMRKGGTERRADPYLSGTLERLAADGVRRVMIGLGLDVRRDEDWAILEADEWLLPERFLTERVGAAPPPEPQSDLREHIARSAMVRCLVDGADLAPSLAGLVGEYAGPWLDHQRHVLRTAVGALEALRPDALFLDREGSRTAWLAAASRLGVRSVAVQHGMIYPDNPEYFQAPHQSLARPDVTCVFGEYERDLLVGSAGFSPDAVAVTGSPRPVAVGSRDGAATERASLRAQLGIADGDRMLLVSVAHNFLLGELLSFAALERVLGGPLPGVRIVVKLHPQDEAPSRHREFLEDLARAGGYETPRISVLQGFDLFPLLRAADAHLGQYSTVLSDAVVAGTPNMVIVGHRNANAIDYVAAGVATPVGSVDEVRAFLADPPPLDPVARQRFLDAHYRSGDATERLAAILRGAPVERSG